MRLLICYRCPGYQIDCNLFSFSHKQHWGPFDPHYISTFMIVPHGRQTTLCAFSVVRRNWWYYVIAFSILPLRGVDLPLESSFMQYSSSLSLPSHLWFTMWNPLTTRFIMGGNHCMCDTCFHTLSAQLYGIADLEPLEVLRRVLACIGFLVLLSCGTLPTNRPH